MRMFDKLAIVSIPVKDQDTAKAFYTNVLGAKVIEDVPFGPGTRWIRLELPGVETRLVLVTWFPQLQPGSLQGIVLTTDDIAQTRSELVSRGLAVTAIRMQPYGQEATFSDTDGNGGVLQQPASAV